VSVYKDGFYPLELLLQWLTGVGAGVDFTATSGWYSLKLLLQMQCCGWHAGAGDFVFGVQGE
jgi:hypothetical protein